jgi:hypothetical protein
MSNRQNVDFAGGQYGRVIQNWLSSMSAAAGYAISEDASV